MPLDLAKLAANDELVERPGWSFDLSIDIEPDEPVWFTVEGINKFAPIGSEGAGGMFVRLPEGRILYMQLFDAHPYWKDAVAALHQAVSTSDVIVRTPHGITCTALFNRFTIDDTPMLRGLVD